jgi:hypothetical protein
MWDAETYPESRPSPTSARAEVTIRYFAGGAYIRGLRGRGHLERRPARRSYDGSPAASSPRATSPSRASPRPSRTTTRTKSSSGARPVAFQLHPRRRLGPTPQPLAVRGRLRGAPPCFEKLVPIVQQAQVDYINDPAATNAMILDAVEQYNTGWVYDEGVAEFSVQQHEGARSGRQRPRLHARQLRRGRSPSSSRRRSRHRGRRLRGARPVPPTIVTNEFIDESIGL